MNRNLRSTPIVSLSDIRAERKLEQVFGRMVNEFGHCRFRSVKEAVASPQAEVLRKILRTVMRDKAKDGIRRARRGGVSKRIRKPARVLTMACAITNANCDCPT